MGKKKNRVKKTKEQKREEKGIVAVDARVIEAKGGIYFLCELIDREHQILAHLGGRVRDYKIVPGDKVQIELSAYDLSRGIIKRRLREDE